MLDTIYKWLEQIGYPHPIHPTEVHMPIGLIVGALLFSLAGKLLKNSALAQTAHYCTILAFIFLFPTLLFGYMDWQHFYAGAWLHAIKVKLVLASVLVVWVAAGLYYARSKGLGSGYVMLNYIVSFLMVVVLGYFGGNLVYGKAQRTAVIPKAYLAGMKVFNENCAACHPKGGNIIDPDFPIVNSRFTRDPAAFLRFIRAPLRADGSPGAMPAFPPDTLTEKQVEDLYGYIVHVLEKRKRE